MEYHNLSKANELADKISYKQNELDEIESKSVSVAIEDRTGYNIVRIPVGPDGNHDFSDLARELIIKSCALLRSQIQELKEELKPL